VPTEDDTLVLSPGIHLEVTFLDMFAKWCKMWLLPASLHISPSVCLHGTTCRPPGGFHETMYVRFLWKFVDILWLWLKSDKSTDTHRRPMCVLIFGCYWFL
jgi:hypothetical protein